MGLTVAHFRIKTQKVSSFFNMLLQNLQTQLAQPAFQLSQQLINKTHRLPFYPCTPFTQTPLCRVSRAGEGPSCNCISLVRRFLRVTCHTTITATVTVASTTFAYAPKTMLRNATKTTAEPPKPPQPKQSQPIRSCSCTQHTPLTH